jgi:hypothetical protein
MTIPTPEELWEYFQQVHYTDEEGNIPVQGCPRIVAPKCIKEGHPDYSIGSVRYATPFEIEVYNKRVERQGEQAARDWLTRRWQDDS